jgi:hypothetical protein
MINPRDDLTLVVEFETAKECPFSAQIGESQIGTDGIPRWLVFVEKTHCSRC